jgi:hypothetical protein
VLTCLFAVGFPGCGVTRAAASTAALDRVSCASAKMTGAGTDICTVTLTAAAGTGGLAIKLSSSSAAVILPASVKVPAGAIKVNFTAKVSPVKTAVTAKLTATQAGTIRSYQVDLNAVKAELSLSATSLAFGARDVGTSTTKAVTLTSSGTGALIISAGTLDGLAFRMSGVKFPLTLDPGQKAAVDIKFDPQFKGPKTGTLTLLTNEAGGKKTINLSGTAAGVPQLALSRTSVAFGNRNVGTSTTEAVTLISAGTAAVTVSAGTMSAPNPFSISGLSFPLTLNPGQRATVSIRFAPQTEGAKSGGLTLTTNASTHEMMISLKGTAVGVPQLTLSATSVVFGSHDVGTSTTKAVTLTSSGTGTVTIGAGSFSTSQPFTMSGAHFPLTLNPGARATLDIKFDPQAAGPKTGTLTLKTNTSRATAAINLVGTAVGVPALTLSATSVTFGGRTLLSSTTKEVRLTSSGTAPLTITRATLDGGAFSISGASFPLTLKPWQNVALAIAFHPLTPGAKTGDLTFRTNTSSGAATISLSGTADAAALSLSASNVAFGTVPVGSSATKTVTLTATGLVPLVVSLGAVTGPGAFSVSGLGSSPLTLSVGQTVTLKVGFSPASAGQKSGTVTLVTNGASGPSAIDLSGTAEAPVGLAGLNCTNGTVAGPATDGCTVSLTGAAPSGGTTINLASSNAAVVVPAAVTVGAGATSAGFTATVSSVTTAQTATMTATQGSATDTLTLNLTTQAPGLALGSASVSFGGVVLNSPATQSVTLTSSGTAPLTISAGSVSGTGFSMSGASFPLTLNSGQTATLDLEFDPTTTGAATGSVTLTSNASSGSTATIALSGTGETADNQINLNWDPPTASTDTVVGYNIFRMAKGSTVSVPLNSSVITSTSYTDTGVLANNTYTYYVVSVDAYGNESSATNLLTVTVQ